MEEAGYAAVAPRGITKPASPSRRMQMRKTDAVLQAEDDTGLRVWDACHLLGSLLTGAHGCELAPPPVSVLELGAGLGALAAAPRPCQKQGRSGRPARPKPLIGRGWLKLGLA